MRILVRYLLLTLLFFTNPCFATTDDQAAETRDNENSPPKLGNFALPGPQQPGPLVSFGQTLIGRNHLQLYLNTFSPYHILPPFDNINASLIYGFTDNTSLYFNYPIEADVRVRSFRSSTLKDIDLQLEHAFYTAGNNHYQEQATIVGAITIPTQDTFSRLSTRSFGSPTYFIGTTYNRTYVDWLFFLSPGALLTTTSNQIRLGSQYLYQAGIGYNILAVPDNSTLYALVEFDGQYTDKTQVLKHNLSNSGGNIIALTPSLSFATERLIAQVGVGFPVVQNLFGKQKKADYFIMSQFILTIV